MLGKKLLESIRKLFSAWEENDVERNKEVVKQIEQEIDRTVEHCDKIEAKLDLIIALLQEKDSGDYYKNDDGLYSYKAAEEKARIRNDRPRKFEE